MLHMYAYIKMVKQYVTIIDLKRKFSLSLSAIDGRSKIR